MEGGGSGRKVVEERMWKKGGRRMEVKGRRWKWKKGGGRMEVKGRR